MSRSSIGAVSLDSTSPSSSSKGSGKRKSSGFLSQDGTFRRIFSLKKRKNVVVQHALALALMNSSVHNSIPEDLEELPERLSAIENIPRLRLRSHSTPSMKLSTSTPSDSARESVVELADLMDTSPKQERSQSLPYTKRELIKRQNSDLHPLTPLNEVCISTASIQLSIADSLRDEFLVKWLEKRMRYRSTRDEPQGSGEETPPPDDHRIPRRSIVFPSTQLGKRARHTISQDSSTEKEHVSKTEKRNSMTFRNRARSASFFAATARMLGIASKHSFKYKWSFPTNGGLLPVMPNLNPYPLDRLFNQEKIVIARMPEAEKVTDVGELASQLGDMGLLDGRIRGRHFDWLRRLHFRRRSEDLLAASIEKDEEDHIPRRVNGRFSTLF
ncbi:hypothetical protein PENTCL1PPCAC_27982 [Pristionchus entomophagus]|uniref:Uncharacterized protein n=1 Tax=Pristionchus entomophagus TaxID=358040 RepID=A0AAV5UGI9_9BILA|nr:hypothetical protein PENTCL1PPCAC_27982 [Pristionchus entomophagus]